MYRFFSQIDSFAICNFCIKITNAIEFISKPMKLMPFWKPLHIKRLNRMNEMTKLFSLKIRIHKPNFLNTKSHRYQIPFPRFWWKILTRGVSRGCTTRQNRHPRWRCRGLEAAPFSQKDASKFYKKNFQVQFYMKI